MKKGKIIAVAGLALLTSGLLAACSGSKSNSAETKFGYVYSGDPETLDYVTSGKATTSDLVTNGVDGLLEMTNMEILYHQWLSHGLYQKMV